MSRSQCIHSRKLFYTTVAAVVLLLYVYLARSRLTVKSDMESDETGSPKSTVFPASSTPISVHRPPAPSIVPPKTSCQTLDYGSTHPNFDSPIIDEFMDLGDDGCYHTSLEERSDYNQDMGLRCNTKLNFWLIWSTSRKDWKIKHYRVIDSIYHFHPNATVHILTKDMTSNDFSFYTSRYKFVHQRLDVDEVFKYTPLDRWAKTSIQDPKIRDHKNFFSHLTDAMRIALLWKYGGVYLDTDAFLLKPIDKIRNTIGYQGGGGGDLNGAVLMFDRQHPFLYYAMHTLIRTYKVTIWGIAGPALMTRCVVGWSNLDPMMVRYIPRPLFIGGNVTIPNEPLGTASISVFMDQFQFYPVSWNNERVDLMNMTNPKVAKLRENIEKRTYVFHYFNQVVKYRKIAEGTLLYELMQKNCQYACNITNVDTKIDEIILNFHLKNQMDWSTISVELLERILIFTESPWVIINASYVCRSWQEICGDQLLWKGLYGVMSCFNFDGDEVNWKKKVLDGHLIRNNIQQGRCVVKTIATHQELPKNCRLEINTWSRYKDLLLVNWQVLQQYSSYFNVSKLELHHLIDLVKEDYFQVNHEDVLELLNHYIVKTTSHFYGGASYYQATAQKFDEEKVRSGQLSFDGDDSVKFQMNTRYTRALIRNYCADSKFVAFKEDHNYNNIKPSTMLVVDVETGAIVFEEPFMIQRPNDDNWSYHMLYDNYVVTITKNQWTITDVITGSKIEKAVESYYKLYMMEKDKIIALFGQDIVIWNYILNTEVRFPAGNLGKEQIQMVYHNMWVTFGNSSTYMNVSFYDIKDGKKVGTVAIPSGIDPSIWQLSDGRIAVGNRTETHVISFVNTEVTRKIKVLLMSVDGLTTEREIMAFELVDFFVENVNIDKIDQMTSAIVPYQPVTSENERYVMIYAGKSNQYNDTISLNETATDLIRKAIKPLYINTPYKAWTCQIYSLTTLISAGDEVRGSAMIVKERRIDGRWQLV